MIVLTAAGTKLFDFGCLHAGITLGYDISPGQTIASHRAVILGRMSLKQFVECYREDIAS